MGARVEQLSPHPYSLNHNDVAVTLNGPPAHSSSAR
jgi:hypothetical protein